MRKFPRPRLFLTALLKIAIFHVYMKILPLPRLLGRLGRKSSYTFSLFTIPACKLNAYGQACGFLLRRVLHSRRACIIRSLMLFEQYVKNGLKPEFVIGVRMENGGLRGHSWIAIGGRPLRGDRESPAKYIVMYTAR